MKTTRPRIEHYERLLRESKTRLDRAYAAAMLNLLVTAARKESVTLPKVSVEDSSKLCVQ